MYLSNYAYLHVRDVLARLPGVGDSIIFGARDYCMRIWIDPDKASARSLTASDIVAAIRRQNVRGGGGAVRPVAAAARQPVPAGGRRPKGGWSTPEEFGDIVLKAEADGQITRLRDVARIELAAADYSIDSRLNGTPAAAIALFQQPGSNAIETANAIEAAMKELKKDFPQGLEYRIAYDTSAFIRESIHAVIETLIDGHAARGVRRGAVPPELAGLADPAGLGAGVADRHLRGHDGLRASRSTTSRCSGWCWPSGLWWTTPSWWSRTSSGTSPRGCSPVDATHKAMDEVSGAVIAIALVLSAVFIPTAFISGITGKFYQQFALTIAVSTLISAFNSLTLSPALCALLLQPHHAPKDTSSAG